jgi:hypothetical protein
MDEYTFLNHLKIVAEEVKPISHGPENFLYLCSTRGLRITYPKAFLDSYYYKKINKRKRLNGGLVQVDE